MSERQNCGRYQITAKILRQDLRHVLTSGIMLTTGSERNAFLGKIPTVAKYNCPAVSKILSVSELCVYLLCIISCVVINLFCDEDVVSGGVLSL